MVLWYIILLCTVSTAGRRGAETMNNNNNKKLIVYSKVLPSPLRTVYRCVLFVFYYTPGCRRWRRPRRFGDWYTRIILFPCVYYNNNNIISARAAQQLSQMTGEVRTRRPPQTLQYSTIIYILYSYVMYTNMLYRAVVLIGSIRFVSIDRVEIV